MATLFVDKLDPQSGTALEIGTSGDTITIPSGATLVNSGTATGFNNPAFYAYLSSDQTINNTTTTEVTFDTEVYDTNSDFASNIFTPTVAGKYNLTMSLSVYSNAAINTCNGSIFKNTTEIARNANYKIGTTQAAGFFTQTQTVVAEANGTSDYFKVQFYHDYGSTRDLKGLQYMTFFHGHRIGT
jgi:hypothetical protein